MLSLLDRRGAANPASDLPRPVVDGAEPTGVVRELIARVRAEGDAALLDLTARFDGAELDTVRVDAEELVRAWEATDPALQRALTAAVDSIGAYHRHQLREPSEFVNPDTGVRVRSSHSPVTRAGCYVPGGRA
ncbi:MAG: histidinol dehydrogenase, partial [Microthrixaceae bacterium]|nr:histidinol dehydrogenase [Microthrixaceae bacterium]